MAGATMSGATASTAAALVLAGALVTPSAAAELQPRTAEAYDEYVAAAERAFLERSRHELELARDAVPEMRLVHARIEPPPRSAAGRMVKVPGGLIHHWRGTIFITGVSLDQVLAVSQGYDRYTKIHPRLLASRLIERRGDTFHIQTRVREDAGMVSAVLDVWSAVDYQRSGAYAHAMGRAREIRQVRNPGASDETHLPAGRDSGYLWRASTFTRFVERDGGVQVDLETLGLSRSFPPLLGWIIEPIARRLGRSSVERSLTELQAAVLRAGK